MSFLIELNNLFFPIRCFGCRKLGIEICSDCRKFWNPHIYQRDLKGLKIVSTISYSPVAKNILLAAKESGNNSANEIIASAMLNSLSYIFDRYQVSAIVPIPSQNLAIRRRGDDFISNLSLKVAKECGVATLPILEHRRRVRDQSKLIAKDRLANLAYALSVNFTKQGNYSGENVVILDDLVTSGATMLEAKRALTKAGFVVRAGATACVALRRP